MREEREEVQYGRGRFATRGGRDGGVERSSGGGACLSDCLKVVWEIEGEDEGLKEGFANGILAGPTEIKEPRGDRR